MAKLERLEVGELAGKKFSIPREYQRGYRWEQTEVEHLLDDIDSSSPGYSLQPLVVKAVERNGDISYDVVDGQQRLTTILLIKGVEPPESFHHNDIDKYFIKNAKNTIESYFEDKNKKEFLDKLDKAFFLFYELDDENPEEVFERLNEGKIPLSSTELLKAWIFTKTGSRLVRTKWREMELACEDDEFFYFINPDADSPRYYASRMDYILELVECNISGSPKDRTSIETEWDKCRQYTFFCLTENNSGKEGKTVSWKEIYIAVANQYETLKAYYDNPDHYIQVGYMLHRKGHKDCYQILVEGKSIAAFKEDVKDSIDADLDDTSEIEHKWEKYAYGECDDKIRNVLLLYNLILYSRSQTNFPYKYFHAESWTLDHIHAKNEKTLDPDSKEFKKLVEEVTALAKRKEWPEFKYEDLNQEQLYNLRDGFAAINRRGYEEKNIEGNWIHSIGNLVLLGRNDNSHFNNNTYINKKIEAAGIGHLLKGTRRAYLEINEDSEFWCKEESSAYFTDIVDVVVSFLEKRIEELKCKQLPIPEDADDEPAYTERDYSPNGIGNSSKAYNLKDLLKHRIVIPDFQRDYAHGRNDARTKYVRSLFLNSIAKVVKGEASSLSLDYVYGSFTKEEDFYPFDGQQRLTTLYLVYCHLAQRNENGSQAHLENFTYAGRSDAEDFCKCLSDMSCKFSLDGPTYNGKDPTVMGMKRVLEDISKELSFVDAATGLDNLDKITFFIPQDISISPNIYWRMNARGKMLSASERFKASFLNNSSLDNFALKLFEHYQNAPHTESDQTRSFDRVLMFMIGVLFDSFSRLKGDEKDSVDFFKPDMVPSSAYKAYQKDYGSIVQKFVDEMGKRDFKSYFKRFDTLRPAYTKKENTRADAVEYLSRLKPDNKMNALIFSYIIVPTEIDDVELKRWLRFCANMIWNTSDTREALRHIYKLKGECGNILSHLIQMTDQSKILALTDQYIEEIEKAWLIKNNPHFEPLVEEAESTAFSDGSILFLYIKKEKCYSWENPIAFDSFEKRLENYSNWFCNEGVVEKYKTKIVKAYISLTPWDYCEFYFNTSKDHWKNQVFAGVRAKRGRQNEKQYEDGYIRIVIGLLESESKDCDVKLIDGENKRATALKKTLLEEEGFKFFLNQEYHDNIQLVQKDSIFVFSLSSPRTTWFWDYDWDEGSVAINRFFNLFNGEIKPDPDYVASVETGTSKDSNNKEIYYTVGPYLYHGFMRFFYNGKPLGIIGQGLIISENELQDRRIDWDKHQEDWIYENHKIKGKDRIEEILKRNAGIN